MLGFGCPAIIVFIYILLVLITTDIWSTYPKTKLGVIVNYPND